MAVAAIHPGEYLSEELKELGMSDAELARNLGVPTNRITGILHGQRSITWRHSSTARAFLRATLFVGSTRRFRPVRGSSIVEP